MTTRQGPLRQDRRGVAAVEFALIAPLLLAMAFGLVETVRFIRIRSCFGVAASSMAELVAAQQGITVGAAGSLHDLCRGVQFELAPYATTTLGISVASYTNALNGSGIARDWESDTGCPATAPMNATTAQSLAVGMVPNPGDSVIVVYATYNYTPWLPNTLPARPFAQYMAARPRYGSVLCTNC